jgi:hypothetical protein
MYKKALHAFFLKVHPDFFAGNKQVQRANEVSIAQLNELLQWAKEFKNGALRGPPATSITLSFYRKPDDEHKSRSMNDGIVTSKFELPGSFAPNEAHRGVAERAVNKFLRDLLRRAECIDSTTEGVSAAEDATAERHEAKPIRPRNIKEKTPKKVRSLLDEAVDSLSGDWSVTAVPTMEELMDAEQVFFSRLLSPVQSAHAMHTLKGGIGEMRYDRWNGMPLLISDHFGFGEVAGCLTVPWDFTPTRFLSFLRSNEAGIVASRQTIESMSKEVETLISEICHHLDLSDVLISVMHADALRCLKFLHRNVDTLAVHNIRGVALEIGTKYATRDNGVLIVDSEMDEAAFLRWLHKISPLMDRQRELYKLATQMLESTMWHLKEFRSMVEPKGIDAFDNELPYAKRLQWAKEMFRIGSNLSQWDWSDMTFAIGPVQISWEEGIVTLPHNFDGDNFLRYVEQIHSEAKTKARDELLKASAMERLRLDDARKSDMLEDALTDEMQQSGGQQDTTAAQQQQLKEKPQLEEYLASDPSGNESLSTERPLRHRVTFQSDEEAEEQLQWEGRLSSPYVQQVPQSDIDDIQAVYYKTNRAFRETAAKKVVDELKAKYGTGSKSNRFRHLKMGDLLGINDPRIKAQGFPILAKGTDQGDKSYSTTPY